MDDSTSKPKKAITFKSKYAFKQGTAPKGKEILYEGIITENLVKQFQLGDKVKPEDKYFIVYIP